MNSRQKLGELSRILQVNLANRGQGRNLAPIWYAWLELVVSPWDMGELSANYSLRADLIHELARPFTSGNKAPNYGAFSAIRSMVEFGREITCQSLYPEQIFVLARCPEDLPNISPIRLIRCSVVPFDLAHVTLFSPKPGSIDKLHLIGLPIEALACQDWRACASYEIQQLTRQLAQSHERNTNESSHVTRQSTAPR